MAVPSLVSCLVLLTGCSVALSGPQPDRRRGEAPRCDTGKGSVVLDGVVAAGLGVGGLAALDASAEVAVVPLALSAAYAAAAFIGSRKVDRCREALARHALEVAPGEDDEPVRALARPVIAPQPAPAPVAAQVEPAAPVASAPAPAAQPAPIAPPAITPTAPPAITPTAGPRPPAPAPPTPPAVRPRDDAWGDFWEEVP